MTLSPEREGRLTGSVWAAAMGINPHQSRQALYRQLKGIDEPFTGNEATEYGNANEPNAVDAYEAHQGVIVQKSGERQAFVIHPEYDWLGCTPDGHTEQRLVEFKCPYYKMYDEPPAYYIAQTIGQMACTGFTECDLAAWSPDELKIWRIEFSAEYWDQMLALLILFWQDVQNGVEPKRRKKPVMADVNYYELI